jgi:hypothetical protein
MRRRLPLEKITWLARILKRMLILSEVLTYIIHKILADVVFERI